MYSGGSEYEPYCDYMGSVKIAGCAGLKIEFDEKCQTESGCDRICFFDKPARAAQPKKKSPLASWSLRATSTTLKRRTNRWITRRSIAAVNRALLNTSRLLATAGRGKGF